MQLTNDLTCAELVELVTEYLEGSLPPLDRLRFEGHLAACPWCANYLDQMRRTIVAVRRLREEDLDAELRDALLVAFHGWSAGSREG